MCFIRSWIWWMRYMVVLSVGVDCEEVSDVYLCVSKWPVFNWLTALCPFRRFMCLWWKRAPRHFFLSSLTVITLAANFMDSLTKPRNNQWKQFPSQCSHCLALLLSVCYYSASSSSLFCNCLCTYHFFCVVVDKRLFRNMAAGRRGRRASVCQYGCFGAGRMEEMTVIFITMWGLNVERHCFWDYIVSTDASPGKMGISTIVFKLADGETCTLLKCITFTLIPLDWL